MTRRSRGGSGWLGRLARRSKDRPRAEAGGSPAATPAPTAPVATPAIPVTGRREREPSLEDLKALAVHAQQRVSLYRRKVLLGRGEPRELAELERISTGAAGRLRQARERRAASR